MNEEKVVFRTANEVKAFLKERGVTDRLRVKKTRSAFGGYDMFGVALADYANVPTIYAGGSREPSSFYAVGDDPRSKEKVEKLQTISDLLRPTRNGMAVQE